MAKDEIVRTNVGVAENVVAGASKKSELDALLLKKKKADAALKEEARADAEQEVSAASDEAVELEAAPAAAAVAAADAGSFIVTESDVGGLIAQAAGGVSNTALLVGGGVLLAGAAVAIASNSDDGDDNDDGTVTPPANTTVTSVTPASNTVAEGESVSFTVKGTPGATFSYTVGGTTQAGDTGVRSGQVVLDSQGNGIIVVAVTADNVVDAAETITVTAGGVTSAAVTVTDVNTNTGGTQLTVNTDVLTANVFTAGLAFTPGGNDRVNTLQDEDVLTGTGTNPTLNVTFGNPNDNGAANITPTLNGIQTLNVDFTANAGALRLDLQDATGLTNAVNVNRISDTSNNVQIDNLLAVPATLSLSNSNSGTATVGFNFAAGAAAAANNAVALNLSRVNVVGLSVEDTDNAIGANVGAAGLSDGVETINLSSAGGPNTIGTFSAEDLRTLNISGAQNLTLGGTANTTGAQGVEATRTVAGLANVGGSLTSVNASTFTGNLTYHIGGEIASPLDNTSGSPVNLTVQGGSGNDTFRLSLSNVGAIPAAYGVQAGDSIDGGAGDNTLVIHAPAVVAGTVSKVQNLEIRSGHDAGADQDTVSVDAARVTDLVRTFIRNEGQTVAVAANGAVAGNSASEDLVARLVNANAAQAVAISVAHGTTGNNDLLVADAPGAFPIDTTLANSATTVNLDVGAGVTTAGVAIVEGINNDARSNFTFIADSDTEAGAANISGLQANNRNGVNTVANINIADNDTESNTVELVEFGRLSSDNRGAAAGHSGTIKLTGGEAGDFLNLDATANAYRYDLTGGDADGGTAAGAANTNGLAAFGHRSDVGAGYAERLIAANIDSTEHLGNVIVRVADSDTGAGGQNIRFGRGNDTVIFDQINTTAANRTSAGLSAADTVNGGEGTDILALDGHGARVVVDSTEWRNVSGIEIVRLIGNGVGANNARGVQNANSYNLELDSQWIARNGVVSEGVRRINIVNDNDASNDVVGVADDANGRAAAFGATGVEGGVNIDARMLGDDGISFQYNGEEGASATADRFIFEDAGLSPSVIIDGGRVYLNAANQATNAANADVIEVVNNANVTLSDLVNVRNVGTLEFTNDRGVAQNAILSLDNVTLNRLVNDGREAGATAATRETLTVQAFDNANVANAFTNLTVNAASVTTAAYGLNINTQNGTDRVDINAAAVGPVLNINLGGQAAGQVDTLRLLDPVAGETYDIVAGAQAGVNILRITSGGIVRDINITGVEQIDVSTFNAAALANLQDAVGVNVNGTAFVNNTPGPVVPPPAGLNAVAVTAGTVAPVAGTAAADSFNFSEAAARATGDNTVITINGFTVAADRLNLDVVNAPTTLQALNGTNGITVQTSLAGNTVASFGPDANGDLISLTFTGIADPSTIQVI